VRENAQVLEFGGIAAGSLMVAFGIASIVLGMTRAALYGGTDARVDRRLAGHEAGEIEKAVRRPVSAMCPRTRGSSARSVLREYARSKSRERLPKRILRLPAAREAAHLWPRGPATVQAEAVRQQRPSAPRAFSLNTWPC
jgi:predicted GIY-YIG superfamily endonuclease